MSREVGYLIPWRVLEKVLYALSDARNGQLVEPRADEVYADLRAAMSDDNWFVKEWRPKAVES